MALDGALLALARAHYQQQQSIVARTTAIAERAWREGYLGWRDVANVLAELVVAAQIAAATAAQGYVVAALAEQGVDADLEGEVNASAFGGLIESPLSLLDTLTAGPLTSYQRAREAGLGAQIARQRGALTVVTMVSTAVADAGRSAEGVATTSSWRARGYTRMLVPPSCPRCTILAGRVYRSATAFRRHKRCDCRHIPVAEDGNDLTTSPKRAFRALSRAEQDRLYGKANAQAIRDGADMSQVVNAQQGLSTINAYGRDVQVTSTGITVRGLAGQRLAAEGLARQGRYRAATTPRLVPEELYRLADEAGWDRPNLLRQLRRFGYLL